MDTCLTYHVVTHEEIDSTNREVRRLHGQGKARDGLVVHASRQTAGYGKWGRPWVSQEGNLFFSLLVMPQCRPPEHVQLTFLAAVALREALLQLPGFDGAVSFKWPNDVRVNGQKIAGILLEAALGQTITDVSVAVPVTIGMGVNVESAPTEGIPYTTTCVNQYLARKITASELLQLLLDKFAILYRQWQQHKMTIIRTHWLPHVDGVGKPCKLLVNGEPLHGVLESIAADGALCLRQLSGELLTVRSGDVIVEKSI